MNCEERLEIRYCNIIGPWKKRDVGLLIAESVLIKFNVLDELRYHIIDKPRVLENNVLRACHHSYDLMRLIERP